MNQYVTCQLVQKWFLVCWAILFVDRCDLSLPLCKGPSDSDVCNVYMNSPVAKNRHLCESSQKSARFSIYTILVYGDTFTGEPSQRLCFSTIYPEVKVSLVSVLSLTFRRLLLVPRVAAQLGMGDSVCNYVQCTQCHWTQ